MSRVDVPTLKCDRCQSVTQDLSEMSCFKQLTYYGVSHHTAWDLCLVCWGKFEAFMEATNE